MNTDSILSTLLAAAAFLKHAAQDVSAQAIKDAYEAVKAHLRIKFSGNVEAVRALDMATAKPESLIRKALLAEESASFHIARDTELIALVDRLAALLPATCMASPWVQVGGSGNRVQVAGRDLIQTTKFVRRNAITPDARHITVEQREQLRRVVAELATRLVGPKGRGGIAAVHAMLHRRFGIPSYLLLARERFAEAVAFLRQQKAAHRSRLRGRDPARYASELYRAIFAGARELGWDGDRVYRFAAEKLGVESPLGSLKELDVVQLKTLATAIQGEVRRARRRRKTADATDPISG